MTKSIPLQQNQDVLSKDAKKMDTACCLQTIAAMKSWAIASFDAAYLQSQCVSRLLILRAARPLPPGVRPGTLFSAKGSVYGTKDAGRISFETLKPWVGFNASWSKAMFFPYDEDNVNLVGIMASHVDDLIVCGSGEKYEEPMGKLPVELHLKKNAKKFRFCSKNRVQREGYSVSLEQVDAIEALEYTSTSVWDGLRGKHGSAGQPGQRERCLANYMGHPKIKDAIALNKAAKLPKDSSDALWCFIKSDLSLENCMVFGCADSSFANAEGMKSQRGYVTGVTTKDLTEGKSAPAMILETNSSSIKRVCRSTLAAKANGFLAGVEVTISVNALIREILDPGLPLRTQVAGFSNRKVLAFTHAKSLESTLTKDAGQLEAPHGPDPRSLPRPPRRKLEKKSAEISEDRSEFPQQHAA